MDFEYRILPYLSDPLYTPPHFCALFSLPAPEPHSGPSLYFLLPCFYPLIGYRAQAHIFSALLSFSSLFPSLSSFPESDFGSRERFEFPERVWGGAMPTKM